MNLNGPGKYDPVAENACRETGAQLLVLIVVGGKHGSGFEVSTSDPRFLTKLQDLLRTTANEIETQTKTQN